MTYIPIGTITKPHGIKGAVHIKADTDFKSERFKIGQTLFIHQRGKRQKVTVKSHFEKKHLDVVSFEEFDTIEAVETLRSATLEIEHSERGRLAEDEFYFVDLIGCDVYVGATKKGAVVDVTELPQGAALRVKKTDDKTALIPFVKAFIKQVDLENERIIVTEIEGLL